MKEVFMFCIEVLPILFIMTSILWFADYILFATFLVISIFLVTMASISGYLMEYDEEMK